MPNSLTSFRLVETATMCFFTASGWFPSSVLSQVRAVRALSIVSAVVNVLETTTISVSSAFSPLSARATSMGSTLARKRSCRPLLSAAASWSVRSALCTNSGPRKLPPMPMATTLFSGLPVTPTHSSSRTLLEKVLILLSTSCTSGTTSLPSTITFCDFLARSAVCSTARSSVMLMCSPLNMASILPRRSVSSASLNSLAMVALVTRWRL
mmetsp:Transcript_16302/g.41691  ORF Transcript_16302/g.41691 Transcript_16302/m.41691 type:complete len:210 (-) Transcript_16302:237-866(-)